MKKLLEVQKQIGTLSKNTKNPFFNSQYLDLSSLIEHVTPILNDQGLVLIQPITDGKVTTSIIDSESGKTIATSDIELPNEQNPQKLGSAITYYRRYTLKSLLAIAEEDDDGNKASKPTPQKDPTREDIVKLIGEATKADDLTKIRAWVKHFDLTDIAITKSQTF